MKAGSSCVVLAILLFLAAVINPARPAAADALKICYDKFQHVIPCPAQRTPRPRRTSTPVPPTFTATATGTPSPTPSATPTGTPTPTESTTPTATVEAFVVPSPGGSIPIGQPIGLDITGTLIYAVIGFWLLIFLGLIGKWLIGGPSANPNAPIPPQGGGRRTRPPSRKAWGAGVLLWLLVGGTIILTRILLLGGTGICGVDAFPDLTPKSVEFTASDYVYFTVANTGPCNAPFALGILYWDTTSAGIKLKALTPPTSTTGWVEVSIPALASGGSEVIKAYLPRSYTTFHGKLWCAFTVDYLNHVKESNEKNNTLIFAP